MAKTKVVVVDDSALVRSILTEIINRQPDMECIGAASDPLMAREMIRSLAAAGVRVAKEQQLGHRSSVAPAASTCLVASGTKRRMRSQG